MAEELLNLETAITERPFLTIDKVKYEVNTVDDMGISKLAQIGAVGKRISRIMEKEDMTDAQAEEIAKSFSKVVKQIVRDLPDEIEAKLKDGQRLAIVNAFSLAAGLTPKTASPKKETETAKV